MEQILGIVFSTCTAFIAYLFFETFLEPKERWNPICVTLLLVAAGAATDALALCFERLFPDFGVIRFALSGIKMYGMFLATMVPLQGCVKRKGSLALLLLAVVQISQIMAGLLYSQLVKRIFDDTAIPVWMHPLVLFSVIHFAFLAAIRCRLKKENRPQKIRRTYLLELAVPSISIAVVYCLYLIDLPTLGINTLFVLAVNIITFLIYGQMEQYHKQNREYALQEQQHRFKEQHYRELETHQTEIRLMKHDLKNQLIAMNAYVQTGSVERAGAQLDILISQLADSGRYAFTPHPGVNGLLAQKYSQAQEEGVLCDFHISLPREIWIADLDLAALVGNILDNALEACRFCVDRRYIRLEIIDRNDLFILKCENSTDGRAQTTRTRKKDAVRHGFGMKNIKQIVEKYNGEMQYHFMSHHFELELTLFCEARQG